MNTVLLIVSFSYFITFVSKVHSVDQQSGALDTKSDDGSTFETRIAGGRPAFPGEIPYQVAIEYKGKIVCGGALVRPGPDSNSQIILTTAQCVSEDHGDRPLKEKTEILILGGVQARQMDSSDTKIQKRKIKEIVRFESWSSKKKDENDIAIIILSNPFELTRFVQVIDLPDATFYPVDNTTLTIAAWGPTTAQEESSGKYSDRLQIITLSTIDIIPCKRFTELYEGQMCAFHWPSDGYKGPCIGDYGAPAAALDSHTGLLYLAGIFCWTREGCGNRRLPAVFTHVASYLSWLSKHMNNLRRKRATRSLPDNLTFKHISRASNARPGEAPYHVQIRNRHSYICNGALVNDSKGHQMILTTAECVTEGSNDLVDINTLDIIAGNVHRHVISEHAQIRNVSRLVRHEKFDRRTKNNIAILYPDKEFKEDGYVMAINLPSWNNMLPADNEYLTVTSWDVNDTASGSFSYPSQLKIHRIRHISTEKCLEKLTPKFTNEFIVPGDILCTWNDVNGDSQIPCYGDAGAPVATVDPNTGLFYLSGLFSWWNGADDGFWSVCGNQKYPSIYTRVSSYLQWIEKQSQE